MGKDVETDARAVRWQAPRMAPCEGENSQTIFAEGPVSPPTAADVAAWEAAGRREGFERGYAEGERQGREALAQQGKGLADVLQKLADVLADFEQEAERELVHLAVIIAQQLVRRELRAEPGEVIPVLREALGLLPSHHRAARVFLHPEDLALVNSVLPSGHAEGGVTLVEDPLLTRGGCRVESESSIVDASLEARLAALAASVLGGARDGD